jgi:hypothetical protein
MTRKSLKEWTDIFVPWIQVVALLAAGTFALVEYQDKQREVRVERAISYLAKLSSAEGVSARLKIAQRMQEKAGRMREILLQERSSQDQTNVAYYQFVIDELVKPGTDQSLEAPFLYLLGALEEGVICAEEGLCDEGTVKSYGKPLIRSYTPYLCYFRQAWGDESIGQRVEMFYNPQAAKTACGEYYQSIARALPASKGEPPNPAAADGREPPLRSGSRP